MKRIWLFLAFAIVLATRGVCVGQQEGDVLSRAELLQGLPTTAEHPIARKVLWSEEHEISCKPAPQRLLVVHYRAEPPDEFGFSDDRVIIALPQGDRYRILKVFDSDAGVWAQKFSSQNDYSVRFVAIRGSKFLYIQNRISGSGGIVEHLVYSISSNGQLYEIPFAEDRKPRLLKSDEELRNGRSRLAGHDFVMEAGIYKPKDPECCPSNGAYHAVFQLSGDFEYMPGEGVYRPNFKFVVVKQWRTAQ